MIGFNPPSFPRGRTRGCNFPKFGQTTQRGSNLFKISDLPSLMLLFGLDFNGPSYHPVRLVLFLTVFPVPGNRVRNEPLGFGKRVLSHFVRTLPLSSRTLISYFYVPDYPHTFNRINLYEVNFTNVEKMD